MSQPTNLIDCRGLSAPLTVLRIKQAVTGRADCGLPLDVLLDGAGSRPEEISATIRAGLNGSAPDLRLIWSQPAQAYHV